jgi:DNA polymerase
MTEETYPDEAGLYEALAAIGDCLNGGLRLSVIPAALFEAAPERDSPQTQTSVRQAPARAPQDAAGSSESDGAGVLAGLEEAVKTCTRCVLSSGRRRAVFGQGVLDPVVLVIGEGPGAEEDKQGLPFVGASGQLLDRMLASIGLFRDKNCYIANIVKCRPPNNREPSPDERAACMPYLRRQIALLKPRFILCAGRTAAQAMLDTSEGINKLRATIREFEGIPLVPTYHPSALLRDESLKRPAWEDLKRLRSLMESDGGARG